MKQIRILSIVLLTALSLNAIGQSKSPSYKLIPGRYEYTHSWDYTAPDSNGTIHCEESGILSFYSQGTFRDNASQRHTLKMETPIKTVMDWVSDDSIEVETFNFDFSYFCHGLWRVENGKFLFCEKAENFEMALMNNSLNDWIQQYAETIKQKNTPNSNRWITFDIERLDNNGFVWSYTYPDGHKDLWELERIH